MTEKIVNESSKLPMIYTGMPGLMGIYERAKLLDGSFQVNSQRGEVTRITIRLPGHIHSERHLFL